MDLHRKYPKGKNSGENRQPAPHRQPFFPAIIFSRQPILGIHDEEASFSKKIKHPPPTRQHFPPPIFLLPGFSPPFFPPKGRSQNHEFFRFQKSSRPCTGLCKALPFGCKAPPFGCNLNLKPQKAKSKKIEMLTDSRGTLYRVWGFMRLDIGWDAHMWVPVGQDLRFTLTVAPHRLKMELIWLCMAQNRGKIGQNRSNVAQNATK